MNEQIKLNVKEYLEWIVGQLIGVQNRLDTCIEEMDPDNPATQRAEDESAALFEMIDHIQSIIDKMED
jgi:hypothetical protein